MQGNLVVYSAPLPFSNKQIRREIPYGANLQEIADAVFYTRSSSYGIIIQINGYKIPRKNWHLVKPKVGTNIVLNVVPQGGGGKKSPIATLLSIAVMVAAPYVGAALGTNLGLTVLGGMGPLTPGMTAFFNGVARIGFSLVGSLLINALAPPPKPSNSGDFNGNPAESPTMFIEGASNQLDPYGVIPIVLGTNRIFPKQAARPYSETENNDQYVRQLFTYGFGKVQLTDFKIGETSIDEFDEVQMTHRLEGDLDQGIDLYANDVFQDDYSVLLREVDGYTIRTTQPLADEVIIDVTFASGLAEFDANGTRGSKNVQLELQFAPHGVSPQVWSPGTSSFKAFSGTTLFPTAVGVGTAYSVDIIGVVTYTGFRKDLVVIDNYTGAISFVLGTGVYSSAASCEIPILPKNAIRLGTLTLKSSYSIIAPTPATVIVALTDDRDVALFGSIIEDSGDFIPSISGSNVDVTGGSLKVNGMDITASQTEALRKTANIKFPSQGQYDIRIKRITADTSSDQIFDEVTLTAIRSVTYRNPVNMPGICGTGIRIKATEQLNGVLSEFNCVATQVIPDYDITTGTWIERPTSNPASICRYVWQGGANARPLADAKIDIAMLEEWHIRNTEKGYTYNRIIDFETSVDEVIRDVCAAGAAAPNICDGKRTVVIDCVKDDISQVITPRNSWGYSGEMTYPDLPHALRAQFRNAAKGYAMDERIVYDDGYDELTATKFEVMELISCTNSDLAFKTARRHLASAKLRPESHSFMLDVENLVAIRGDRIKLAHDAPIIGIGDGRIKSFTLNADSPQLVTGITIDDTVTIPSASTFYVRIRCNDGTTIYKEITEGIGDHVTFTFAAPFLPDGLEAGNLCYFVEAGQELDLIITRIEPQSELTARVTAINYAPEVFTAESTTIPPFDSQITTPLSLIRPLPPVLENIQSNESVMLRNSDGTYTSRLVITLRNDNDGDIESSVSIRPTGTTSFSGASTLERTESRVVIAGLQDGTSYDIYVRYRRRGSSQFSVPLQINSYQFIGAGDLPDDVTGFMVSIAEGLANFKWDQSGNIDLAFYRMKFSRVFSGASWNTAQLLEDNLLTNRLTTTFQGGTYLIKAVDILGNESENTAEIITYEEGNIRNVVDVLVEDPSFSGSKTNVSLLGSALVLTDATLDGYYYFSSDIDLTDVFTAFVSAAIVATGTFVGGGDTDDLFAADDLFELGDLFGVGSGGWFVQLQYRTTEMNPASSPVTWSAWQELTAGNILFRDIQFRLLLRSLSAGISPLVTGLAVTVDMPDRIEADNDLAVGTGGLRIDFDPPFKALDGLSIVAQNLATGDYATITSKSELGFNIIFRNAAATAVARTFDYVAAGYGRVVA